MASALSLIRIGFLFPAERRELEGCVRRQREDYRIARRTNAILLLDDGKSCKEIAEQVSDNFRLTTQQNFRAVAGWEYRPVNDLEIIFHHRCQPLNWNCAGA